MTVKEQKRPWYGQHGVNGPRARVKIIRKDQAAIGCSIASLIAPLIMRRLRKTAQKA
jgi:hypothetical protein